MLQDCRRKLGEDRERDFVERNQIKKRDERETQKGPTEEIEREKMERI